MTESNPGTNRGGYGAYSTGVYNGSINSKLYINVGGAGKQQTEPSGSGGYNGGGNVMTPWSYDEGGRARGSGGGATHIALDSGLLRNISSHKTDGRILIVAGAGGGGYRHPTTGYHGDGGDAGGIQGNNGKASNGSYYGIGGTQSSAGCSYSTNASCGGFGYGGDNDGNKSTSWSNGHGSAGGSCYYGGGGSVGYGSIANSSGAGGSSYIGSSTLISGGGVTKHMTCYSCTTSSDANTQTYSNTNVSATATADYSKIGNGFARITYLGTSI